MLLYLCSGTALKSVINFSMCVFVLLMEQCVYYMIEVINGIDLFNALYMSSIYVSNLVCFFVYIYLYVCG